MDTLTNKPQTVWIGGHTSSTLVINTGAPQGFVLHSTLYIHDYKLRHGKNSAEKYADDTVINWQISNKNLSSAQEEINSLAEGGTKNNLLFNLSRTKELIVNFRKMGAMT